MTKDTLEIANDCVALSELNREHAEALLRVLWFYVENSSDRSEDMAKVQKWLAALETCLADDTA